MTIDCYTGTRDPNLLEIEEAIEDRHELPASYVVMDWWFTGEIIDEFPDGSAYGFEVLVEGVAE